MTVLGGSSHIHIEGLRIELTGGDGISIGAGMAAVDVVVRNVTCDRNYRQGMSVINGELMAEKKKESYGERGMWQSSVLLCSDN